MVEFYCSNLNCENNLKSVPVEKYRMVMNRETGKVEPKGNLICPLCGSPLVAIEEDPEEIQVSFSAFSHKSSREKGEILKKRAHKHYERYGGRDEKEYRKNKVVKNYFGNE
jgi:hypothetical protein